MPVALTKSIASFQQRKSGILMIERRKFQKDPARQAPAMRRNACPAMADIAATRKMDCNGKDGRSRERISKRQVRFASKE
jgi:hypothetical protein